MNSKIIEIAKDLKKFFIDDMEQLNEISIFLCGGKGTEEEKFRRIVGNNIAQTLSKYSYSVYYPEDMFIDLILGHGKHDLLTLENLLANSVNSVVILLQSPGTFTELGAFSNHKDLKDKLIVIVDPKYKRSKSFINFGPIRHLESKTKSRVIFSNMNVSNLKNLVKETTDAARDIAKYSTPLKVLSNPVASYNFYLALVYVFDSVQKSIILDIPAELLEADQNTAVTVAEAVINTLVNERKIISDLGRLSITDKGIANLIYENSTKRRSSEILSFLSHFRLNVLNLGLRTKYNNILKGVVGS